MKYLLLTAAISILLAAFSASAYWPTTVEENLIIAATPGVQERYVSAHPTADDKIIVIYGVANVGPCYQIINKYGELLLPLHELLCPGLTFYQNSGIPESISDGEGGVIACWGAPQGAMPGIYAQRIDSDGNRLWGQSGVRAFPIGETYSVICTDGAGGFYLGVIPDTPAGFYGNYFVQRVSEDGNLMFGDSGMVVIYTPEGLTFPIICNDGGNGCFISWEDNRPPYTGIGASFVQHLDGNGNTLWAQDLFICQDAWAQWHKMIPDGAGGIIFQIAGLADYNIHYRIDGQGNILWQRDHLSWWYWGGIIPGEPGYCYLCFDYNDGLYGQRLNISTGANCWPTWGSGQAGALLYQIPSQYNFFPTGAMNLAYYDHILYVIHAYSRGSDMIPVYYRINGLDSLGNRLWGDNGVLISVNTETYIFDSNLIPSSEEGIVSVFQEKWVPNTYDVAAKRINFDGSIGGPNAPLDEVTITVSGMDLTLRWPSQAPGAEYYIYKSVEAYVFQAQPDTVISDTTFIEANGVLQESGFYRITWQP